MEWPRFIALSFFLLAMGSLVSFAIQDFIAVGVNNTMCLLPCR